MHSNMKLHRSTDKCQYRDMVKYHSVSGIIPNPPCYFITMYQYTDVDELTQSPRHNVPLIAIMYNVIILARLSYLL